MTYLKIDVSKVIIGTKDFETKGIFISKQFDGFFVMPEKVSLKL